MDTSVTDFNSHLKNTVPKFSTWKKPRKEITLQKLFFLNCLQEALIYYNIFHCEKFIHLQGLVIALTQVQKDRALGLVQYEACMSSLLKPVRLLLGVIPQVYQLHLNAEVAFNPTVYVIKKDIR